MQVMHFPHLSQWHSAQLQHSFQPRSGSRPLLKHAELVLWQARYLMQGISSGPLEPQRQTVQRAGHHRAGTLLFKLYIMSLSCSIACMQYLKAEGRAQLAEQSWLKMCYAVFESCSKYCAKAMFCRATRNEDPTLCGEKGLGAHV